MKPKYGREDGPNGSYKIHTGYSTEFYDKNGKLTGAAGGIPASEGDLIGDLFWAFGVVIGLVVVAILII